MPQTRIRDNTEGIILSVKKVTALCANNKFPISFFPHIEIHIGEKI